MRDAGSTDDPKRAEMTPESPTHGAAQARAALPPRTTNGTESRKERGVVLRVLVYVVVAHALAAFIWLLFVVGAHSN